MGKLDGQVALITGGTKGIGEAAVRLFVQEGARVVLCGRARQDGERIAAELNGGGTQRAAFFALDVADYENWKQAVSFVKDTFGKLNILINNAGIGEQKMIDETDDDWMMYVMNTNLGGPMRYIREALKIFLPKNDGVIINVSSVNGNRPFCGATYTSTKGALNTLTKNVAMRLIDTNIR